jgi:hypothetical protein
MHENLISERVGVYRGRNYNAIGHLIKYLPFGEVFIEERNNSWNTPYLFNGKELDEGTGLYYYAIQIRGGNSSRLVPDRPSAIKFTGEYGSSERIFKQATNISVDNPQGLLGDFHNSHNRIGDWINQLSE